MTESSTARHQKTIAFTANEGSGNTITVTTTAEGMPVVVAFFAQTSWENVALTINGTAYDFTPASQRTDITPSLPTTLKELKPSRKTMANCIMKR